MSALPSRYTRLSGPPGGWKGALHLHTTLSDGRMAPDELLGEYRRLGYDFAVVTDHNRTSGLAGGREDGLLVIDGIEVAARNHGANLHVVAFPVKDLSIGLFTGLRRFVDELVRPDAFTIVCHPHWSDNGTPETHGLGVDAVEVYNHDCEQTTGKGHALAHWDYALARGEDLLGVAVDDTHYPMSVGGGWVRVFAPRCTERDVMAAMKRGRFYSSNGPTIYGLAVRRGRLIARTSPVTRAYVIGRNGRCGARPVDPDAATLGGSGEPEVAIDLPLPDPERLRKRMGYIRLQVTDERTGRSGWTNALYPPCRPAERRRG